MSDDSSARASEDAAFAASIIPGARLLRFEAGGHFVMVVEPATIRPAVRKHILDDVNGLSHGANRTFAAPFALFGSGGAKQSDQCLRG